MGHFAFCALLGCLLLAASAIAQSPTAKPADFAGIWKAEFKKQTWLVLNLHDDKGALTGALTHSTYLSADNEGDLTSVGDEMSNAKIEKATLDGSVLHLLTKDDEGDEDRYDLTLTGPNSAELKPMSSDGSPTPKAFKLKRTPEPSQK